MADKKRLIDANALIKHMKDLPTRYEDGGGSWLCLDGYPKGMFDPEDVISSIDNAPTVDAVEVVHGRWEKAHIAGYLKCNCCKDAFIYEEWLESGKWNYCPNCGAKMDGDVNG